MPASTASETDLQTVARLAHDIWMEHYPPIIGEEQTRYMLNKLYSLEALQEQRKNGLHFFLWHEGSEVAGFAGIDLSSYEYGFLSKLYLSDRFRGKGVAANFLAYLEDRFREAGKPSVRLTVNRLNIGAINFYFKSGFRILRTEDTDIGNGYFMNDFVMQKNF